MVLLPPFFWGSETLNDDLAKALLLVLGRLRTQHCLSPLHCLWPTLKNCQNASIKVRPLLCTPGKMYILGYLVMFFWLSTCRRYTIPSSDTEWIPTKHLTLLQVLKPEGQWDQFTALKGLAVQWVTWMGSMAWLQPHGCRGRGVHALLQEQRGVGFRGPEASRQDSYEGGGWRAGVGGLLGVNWQMWWKESLRRCGVKK